MPTSRLYAVVICFGIFALGTSCIITWFDEYLGDIGRLAQNELLQKHADQRMYARKKAMKQADASGTVGRHD